MKYTSTTSRNYCGTIEAGDILPSVGFPSAALRPRHGSRKAALASAHQSDDVIVRRLPHGAGWRVVEVMTVEEEA